MVFSRACFPNRLPALMLLQAKAMQRTALSIPPVSPASGPPSLEVEGSPEAKQSTAKPLPKARKRAGLGCLAKGMEAVKTRAAAGSRGQQHTPGGAGPARIPAQTLAATAAKLKPNTNAAPQKAAAVHSSSLGQAPAGGAVEPQGEHAQQQVGGHVEISRPWLISSHLVQLIPGKFITPWSGSQHCNLLHLPSSIMQSWYPDLLPGSSLHLQIKVPPAAATAQVGCGPCSQRMAQQDNMMEVPPSREADTSASPTQACGTGVISRINNRLVQDVVAKRGTFGNACRLGALQQVLHPYLRWKLVYLEKVRYRYREIHAEVVRGGLFWSDALQWHLLLFACFLFLCCHWNVKWDITRL